MTPDQLTFDLPSVPSLERGDFFVSKSNQFAFKMIEDWQNWALRKCILFGPKSSGKTHLAHVWAKMSHGHVVSAKEIADPERASDTNLAILHVDACVGDVERETVLFHLHNLTLAKGHSLLVCGEKPPPLWNVELADLKSRLEGSPYVKLDEPDDELFAALLKKLFKDRQLTPTPKALSYVVLRLERSYTAAANFVDIADRVSLAEKKQVTRSFAKQIIEEHITGDD